MCTLFKFVDLAVYGKFSSIIYGKNVLSVLFRSFLQGH